MPNYKKHKQCNKNRNKSKNQNQKQLRSQNKNTNDVGGEELSKTLPVGDMPNLPANEICSSDDTYTTACAIDTVNYAMDHSDSSVSNTKLSDQISVHESIDRHKNVLVTESAKSSSYCSSTHRKRSKQINWQSGGIVSDKSSNITAVLTQPLKNSSKTGSTFSKESTAPTVLKTASKHTTSAEDDNKTRENARNENDNKDKKNPSGEKGRKQSKNANVFPLHEPGDMRQDNNTKRVIIHPIRDERQMMSSETRELEEERRNMITKHTGEDKSVEEVLVSDSQKEELSERTGAKPKTSQVFTCPKNVTNRHTPADKKHYDNESISKSGGETSVNQTSDTKEQSHTATYIQNEPNAVDKKQMAVKSISDQSEGSTTTQIEHLSACHTKTTTATCLKTINDQDILVDQKKETITSSSSQHGSSATSEPETMKSEPSHYTTVSGKQKVFENMSKCGEFSSTHQSSSSRSEATNESYILKSELSHYTEKTRNHQTEGSEEMGVFENMPKRSEFSSTDQSSSSRSETTSESNTLKSELPHCTEKTRRHQTEVSEELEVFENMSKRSEFSSTDQSSPSRSEATSESKILNSELSHCTEKTRRHQTVVSEELEVFENMSKRGEFCSTDQSSPSRSETTSESNTLKSELPQCTEKTRSHQTVVSEELEVFENMSKRGEFSSADESSPSRSEATSESKILKSELSHYNEKTRKHGTEGSEELEVFENMSKPREFSSTDYASSSTNRSTMESDTLKSEMSHHTEKTSKLQTTVSEQQEVFENMSKRREFFPTDHVIELKSIKSSSVSGQSNTESSVSGQSNKEHNRKQATFENISQQYGLQPTTEVNKTSHITDIKQNIEQGKQIDSATISQEFVHSLARDLKNTDQKTSTSTVADSNTSYGSSMNHKLTNTKPILPSQVVSSSPVSQTNIFDTNRKISSQKSLASVDEKEVVFKWNTKQHPEFFEENDTKNIESEKSDITNDLQSSMNQKGEIFEKTLKQHTSSTTTADLKENKSDLSTKSVNDNQKLYQYRQMQQVSSSTTADSKQSKPFESCPKNAPDTTMMYKKQDRLASKQSEDSTKPKKNGSDLSYVKFEEAVRTDQPLSPNEIKQNQSQQNIHSSGSQTVKLSKQGPESHRETPSIGKIIVHTIRKAEDTDVTNPVGITQSNQSESTSMFAKTAENTAKGPELLDKTRELVDNISKEKVIPIHLEEFSQTIPITNKETLENQAVKSEANKEVEEHIPKIIFHNINLRSSNEKIADECQPKQHSKQSDEANKETSLFPVARPIRTIIHPIHIEESSQQVFPITVTSGHNKEEEHPSKTIPCKILETQPSLESRMELVPVKYDTDTSTMTSFPLSAIRQGFLKMFNSHPINTQPLRLQELQSTNQDYQFSTGKEPKVINHPIYHDSSTLPYVRTNDSANSPHSKAIVHPTLSRLHKQTASPTDDQNYRLTREENNKSEISVSEASSIKRQSDDSKRPPPKVIIHEVIIESATSSPTQPQISEVTSGYTVREKYPTYRVDSPQPEQFKPTKLSSLDSNEFMIQEVSDNSSTADTDNPPIISEAESESESIDTVESTLACQPDVIAATPETTSTSKSQEDYKARRQLKRAALESHFLPQFLSPIYLDSIKEEGSECSDSDRRSECSDRTDPPTTQDDIENDATLNHGHLAKNADAVFPKSTLDFSKPHKHNHAKVRQPKAGVICEEAPLPSFVETKLIEQGCIEESCSSWSTNRTPEVEAAEVVYINSASSSVSDLSELDYSQDQPEETTDVRIQTPTIDLECTSNILLCSQNGNINQLIPPVKEASSAADQTINSLPTQGKNDRQKFPTTTIPATETDETNIEKIESVSENTSGLNCSVPLSVRSINFNPYELNSCSSVIAEDVTTNKSDVFDRMENLRDIVNASLKSATDCPNTNRISAFDSGSGSEKNLSGPVSPPSLANKILTLYDISQKQLESQTFLNILDENKTAPDRPQSPESHGSDHSESTTQSQCTAINQSCNNCVSGIQIEKSTETISTQTPSKESSSIKKLKTLCAEKLASFSYGREALEELAAVAKNISSMPYPLPHMPHIEHIQLSLQAQSKQPSVITLAPIPPSAAQPFEKAPTPPPPPVPERPPNYHSWLGIPTEKDPSVLVCLSPAQITAVKNSSTPDGLLDIHQKFIDRRGYHEYTKKQVDTMNQENFREPMQLRKSTSPPPPPVPPRPPECNLPFANGAFQNENQIQTATSTSDQNRISSLANDRPIRESDDHQQPHTHTHPTTTTTPSGVGGQENFVKATSVEKQTQERFSKSSQQSVTSSADMSTFNTFENAPKFPLSKFDTIFDEAKKRFSNIETQSTSGLCSQIRNTQPKRYSNIETSSFESRKYVENGQVMYDIVDSNRETVSDGEKRDIPLFSTFPETSQQSSASSTFPLRSKLLPENIAHQQQNDVTSNNMTTPPENAKMSSQEQSPAAPPVPPLPRNLADTSSTLASERIINRHTKETIHNGIGQPASDLKAGTESFISSTTSDLQKSDIFQHENLLKDFDELSNLLKVELESGKRRPPATLNESEIPENVVDYTKTARDAKTYTSQVYSQKIEESRRAQMKKLADEIDRTAEQRLIYRKERRIPITIERSTAPYPKPHVVHAQRSHEHAPTRTYDIPIKIEKDVAGLTPRQPWQSQRSLDMSMFSENPSEIKLSQMRDRPKSCDVLTQTECPRDVPSTVRDGATSERSLPEGSTGHVSYAKSRSELSNQNQYTEKVWVENQRSSQEIHRQENAPASHTIEKQLPKADPLGERSLGGKPLEAQTIGETPLADDIRKIPGQPPFEKISHDEQKREGQPPDGLLRDKPQEKRSFKESSQTEKTFREETKSVKQETQYKKVFTGKSIEEGLPLPPTALRESARFRRAESMFNISETNAQTRMRHDDWLKYINDIGSSENICKPFQREVEVCYLGRRPNIRAPRLTASTNDLSRPHNYDIHGAYDAKKGASNDVQKPPPRRYLRTQSVIDTTPITPCVSSYRQADSDRKTSQLHDEHLQYISNKEQQLKREFERLENERRQLLDEINRNQIAQKKNREIYRQRQLPTLTEDETFRQQMAEEWLNKVAEREERRLQKVIKISKVDQNANVPVAPPRRTSSTDIGDEFLRRVKERRSKLSMPSDSDWESGAESYPLPRTEGSRSETDEPSITIIEGQSQADIKNLPKHLREFAKLTTQFNQEKREEVIENSSCSANKKCLLTTTVKTTNAGNTTGECPAQQDGRYSYKSNGYMSEPEPSYDSDYSTVKYRTLERRHLQSREHDEEPGPKSTTDDVVYGTMPNPVKSGQGSYKVQPGRIEDYTTGHSSLSEKEKKEHFDQQKLSQHYTKGNLSRALLGDQGYTSDSNLVFRKKEVPPQSALSPVEQKQVYKSVQEGGQPPLFGFRKPAPEKPKESPNRYFESDVNIHYKTPIRYEYKDPIPEEELAVRQAEAMQKIYQEERRRKYLQELQDMTSRRHTDNFIPSQKSPIALNRYDDFNSDLAPKSPSGANYPKTVARALYNFQGHSARELTFKKGDIIYIRRQIDKNWYEGEHNAMIGLLPSNYVEILTKDSMRQPIKKASEGQARAKYNFQAQTGIELSLNKGEIVNLTRRVDENWFEGKIANRKGIFPVSYVEVLVEIGAEDKARTGTSVRPSLDTLRTNVNNEFNSLTSNGRPPNGILRETKALHKTEVLHVDTNTEPIAYRALYKYRPQNTDELELQEGDIVYVLEKCDDGWFVGTSQRTGCFGTFPGNYVERVYMTPKN